MLNVGKTPTLLAKDLPRAHDGATTRAKSMAAIKRVLAKAEAAGHGKTVRIEQPVVASLRGSAGQWTGTWNTAAREAHLQILELEERGSFDRNVGRLARFFAGQIPNDDAANLAKNQLTRAADNADRLLQKVERAVIDSVSSWADGQVYLTPEERKNIGDAVKDAGKAITRYDEAAEAYDKSRNRRIREYINEAIAAGPK